MSGRTATEQKSITIIIARIVPGTAPLKNGRVRARLVLNAAGPGFVPVRKSLKSTPQNTAQSWTRKRPRETRNALWSSGFILSGNTYPNRDAIYKDGGRWCRFLKAYIAPRPIDGLRGIKITPTSAEALCNAAGYVDIDKALKLSETL